MSRVGLNPVSIPTVTGVMTSLGIWGACTAYHLNKAGADVDLYDMWGAGNSRSGSGGACLLYTSPSPRDRTRSRMPSSA